MPGNLMNLSDVVVADGRIRKEFNPEKLAELEESIFLSGQLQPIVIDSNNTLICGERRLRALHNLHSRFQQGELDLKTSPSVFARDQIANGHILAVDRIDLEGDAALEAELAENLRRSDLTWQEQAAAVKRLHHLRLEQKGPPVPGRPGGQTYKATATEIVGDNPTSNDVKKVSTDVLLADFLDDPFVAAAATPADALRIIKKLEKEKDLQERAKTFDPSSTPHQLIMKDAYEWMREGNMPPADVIICDPPYGRDLHKQGMANEHEYDDSEAAWDKWCQEMPELLYARAASQAHVYVFLDFLNWTDAVTEMMVAGFTVWKRPLIWDKGHIGSYGKIEYGPRHTYDTILFANKGNKETVIHTNDVITNIPQDTNMLHPAGKPMPLLADLLKRSGRPGDIVIDPMVGGGTLFPAASYCQMTAYCCEGHPTYYNMAVEALKETIV